MKYIVGNDHDRKRLADLQRIAAAGDKWPLFIVTVLTLYAFLLVLA